MSSFMRWSTLLFACLAVIQPGCDRETPTETLTIRFNEMKAATEEFYALMGEVTDSASAETILPELEKSHERLAIAVHELDLAEATSSRATLNIKREIADFKLKQKAMFKKEFERLKSDELVKAVLEPFLHRINALSIEIR